jgi:hypothetical protein
VAWGPSDRAAATVALTMLGELALCVLGGTAGYRLGAGSHAVVVASFNLTESELLAVRAKSKAGSSTRAERCLGEVVRGDG